MTGDAEAVARSVAEDVGAAPARQRLTPPGLVYESWRNRQWSQGEDY
jgi:hypothetical protein